MKPVQIDKQSVLDAALMLIGSAIGAAASVAVFVYLFAKKEFRGQPPAAKPTGEPRNQ